LERDGKPEGILDGSKGLHLTYGYVITSNAAQGKTVDWAIPSLPVHSLSMATRELSYVLCSRARYGCKVLTDSKTGPAKTYPGFIRARGGTARLPPLKMAKAEQ
jgi:hypothetical protein